jgi:hypothetical protein
LQSEWQGYNNESDNGSSQGYFSSSTFEYTVPRPKEERPTELLLTTKELEDGYANIKPQGNKTTAYLEQFWVCTKRYEYVDKVMDKKFIIHFINRRKERSVGFGKISEARKNLLPATKSTK